LGSKILQLVDLPQKPLEIRNPSPITCEKVKQRTKTCNFFYGASSKDGVGAIFVFISPSQEII
jgi:hypothetical protein